MNQFAYIPRIYPMSSGDYPSTQEPSQEKQDNGFKPTYKDTGGALVAGDSVEYKELNFIIADLYKKAVDMDSRLTTLEGE